VFAASVSGLFLAISDQATKDPKRADTLEGYDSAVDILRAGFAALVAGHKPLKPSEAAIVGSVIGASCWRPWRPRRSRIPRRRPRS
jgi:hypothetical protein